MCSARTGRGGSPVPVRELRLQKCCSSAWLRNELLWAASQLEGWRDTGERIDQKRERGAAAHGLLRLAQLQLDAPPGRGLQETDGMELVPDQ